MTYGLISLQWIMQMLMPLSRLPLNESIGITLPPELILVMKHIANSSVAAKEIAQGTKADSILSHACFTISEFRMAIDSCPDDSLEYDKTTELSLHDGSILLASRVVIPGKCRKQLLAELHEGHFAARYYKVESKDSIMNLVARCMLSLRSGEL